MVLLGAGWGAAYPGIFALVVDRAPETQRGYAVAILTAALDLAFGLGQLAVGGIVATAGYHVAFLSAAVSAALATVIAVSAKGAYHE
jgi:MFS family permease